VQHIALATDDLFTFVEAAKARGVGFLDIPDNYYTDLGTRFEIEPELLARMRRLDILYDRNRNGEFFHIYTTTLENHFFFEIVERRGYDQYGAANTPVRLAAQVAEQER
jgi:4-hydroxyphenylpyruvate dioxygenase